MPYLSMPIQLSNFFHLFCSFCIICVFRYVLVIACGGGTLAHTGAQGGWTALMRAARLGHADCARLLLDAGADKNAKGEVRASAGVACGPRRRVAGEGH